MTDAKPWDKSRVLCSICNIVMVWNGNGKRIASHINGKMHIKKLKAEADNAKRARSIVVKGVSFASKYYRPITKFFGKYAAVESTFRISVEGSSVFIVRFFNPTIVRKFLESNSVWIIDGQYAQLLPDIYTKHHRKAKRVVGKAIGVISASTFVPPPPTIQEDEWNTENGYQDQYNDDTVLYNKGSDLRDSVNSDERNNDEHQTVKYNEGMSSNIDYSTSNHSKNTLGNEYRSVEFVEKNDKSEPVKYQEYSRNNDEVCSIPVHYLDSNIHEKGNYIQRSETFLSGHSSKSNTENLYMDKSGQRERDDYKTNNQDIGRRDRSRSPIQRDYSKFTRNLFCVNNSNKRILPKLKGSTFHGPFSNQIENLLKEVNFNVCKPNMVKNVCEDIRNALNNEFRGVIVRPFGSMNLGVGIRGASLEVCIYLPDDIKSKLLQNKSLCAKYLESISSILRSSSSCFRNVNFSGDAVNFTHNLSKYNIKVGLLRDAMVLNDELFGIYMTSDRRLIPIFVFLMFWAYAQDIMEESVFEDNEMILLIIFYLQRLSKPILPPAHMLQVDDGGIHIDNKCLSYWHSTFLVNPNTFPRNENSSDLLSLIEGFYLFYSDFSFKNVVVSPFSGLIIPSEVFRDNGQLPVEFKRYNYLVTKKYVYPLNTESSMCIQDPIKLNHNATITITSTKLAHFREKCLSASGLMYKFRMKKTEIGLISALLNLPEDTVDHVHKISSQIATRYTSRLNDDDMSLMFRRLTNLLCEVVTKVMKGRFIVEREEHYLNKNHSTDMTIVYNCTQYYNLWSTRKLFSSKIPYNSNSLDWETSLSDKILDSVYKNQSRNAPIFEFTIKGYVKRIEKVLLVNLVFKDVEKDLFDGFISFITPILDYELKRISIV